MRCQSCITSGLQACYREAPRERGFSIQLPVAAEKPQLPFEQTRRFGSTVDRAMNEAAIHAA